MCHMKVLTYNQILHTENTQWRFWRSLKGGPIRKLLNFSKFSGVITERMRQHGKGKISFGQNIRTYLRISWNLGDEIFPKGVGVVTPQIFELVFFQTSGLLEEGDLIFSWASSKIFLAKVFGVFSSLVFDLEDLLLGWLKPKLSFKEVVCFLPYLSFVF